MGEFTNKTVGNVKKTVGRVTGRRRLEGEGAAQNAKGNLQGAGRKVKRGLRNAKDAVRAKAGNRPARKRTVKAAAHLSDY